MNDFALAAAVFRRHFFDRKEALAVTDRAGKIYAPQPREKIQRSSVVERSAVNRLVVGSNPTAGAIFYSLPLLLSFALAVGCDFVDA